MDYEKFLADARQKMSDEMVGRIDIRRIQQNVQAQNAQQERETIDRSTLETRSPGTGVTK